MRTDKAGHDLVEDLDNGRLDLPHIRKGFGHFQADESGPDNDRFFRTVVGNRLFDGNGIPQIGNGENIFQVFTGQVQPSGIGAGGDDQLVVGQGIGGFVFFPDVDDFFLAVDFCGFGAGQGDDAFVLQKETFIPNHMETGGTQLGFIADIS